MLGTGGVGQRAMLSCDAVSMADSIRSTGNSEDKATLGAVSSVARALGLCPVPHAVLATSVFISKRSQNQEQFGVRVKICLGKVPFDKHMTHFGVFVHLLFP